MLQYLLIIVCATEISLVKTQEESSPSVLIIENDQTVKEGESLSLTCIVSNPVAGGTFVWTHRLDAAGATSLYTTDTSDPRITVTVVSETSSTLMVTELSSDDTGLISCHYSYILHGESILISANRSVCVATQPVLPPFCFEGSSGTETVSLICSAENQCPEDTILRWFDTTAGSMQELTGDVARSTATIENLINITRPEQLAKNYLCKLESKLYPNVSLNCSNVQLPKMPDVMSTIGSLPATSSIAKSANLIPTASLGLSSTKSIPSRTDSASSATDKQKIPLLTNQRSPVDIVVRTSSSSVNSVTNRTCICDNNDPYFSSSSSDWSVYTTVLFAVIACISIVVNIYFGLQYHNGRNEATPTKPVTDKPNTSNMQESYMELGECDDLNKAYMALKSGTSHTTSSKDNPSMGQPATEGAYMGLELDSTDDPNKAYMALKSGTITETTGNYEVTLPSMAKASATAKSGDVNEKGTDKPYVNADRVEEFRKRATKSTI